ncbi:uncharacterized protein FMAN_13498 [Fusarium mangiferae]|uniref:RRM domain-containing protein n=1 Tax=Fusarium mangiferae TaxID=192010 RepID=A0A1L7TKU0_FUSMA|nr:uncharacterized protein FMAN_13498 [Fusarium mangiferae]CVK95416.1 uncharacterized protein FMAN_13498 [Fusarium mangiferae]
MDQIPNSLFEEGRLAFLGGIPLDAEKQEVEAFWLEPSGWNHQGYCIVEFTLQTEAKEAIKRLPDCAFKDKYLQTKIPQRRNQPTSQSITSKLPVEAEAIPTDAEAVTTATEPEPSFESPPVEPPSSDPFAAQISLVDDVSAGYKAIQERIRKDLQELKYPEAYACSEHWSKSDVENAVIGRMLEREKEDGAPGSLVVKHNGRFRIRSRVFPSPYDDDIKGDSTIWIHVTKRESDGRKMKIIALSELPLYEEDGWQEWFKGNVSAEESTGDEQHHVSTVGDINAPDGPKQDTL